MKFEDWLIVREGKEEDSKPEVKKELFDDGKVKGQKDVKTEKKAKPKAG